MDDDRRVMIPEVLYRRIESLLPHLGFDSVDAYVTHALQEVLASRNDGEPFTIEEEEDVKDRLRALGYLD